MIIPRLSYRKLAASDTAEFDRELFSALAEFGFVVIADHPIESALLGKAFDKTQQLFALPDNIKSKYDSGAGGERGFTAFGRETAKGHDLYDLKEHWHIGREFDRHSPLYEFYPRNFWPDEVPEFKLIFGDLYRLLEAVAQNLLLSIGRSLGFEPNYFQNITENGNSVLRLLHYPPTEASSANSPEHGFMRAAPHADINLMTLLVGASAPGLQLLSREDHWLEVAAEANDIIVDTGDMMALITNDMLPATVHRVVNPCGENTSRYSMPFFLHPRSDAMLACHSSCTQGRVAGYDPILAGDFLKQRLIENGLYNKARE